jgi:hypothetical protein
MHTLWFFIIIFAILFFVSWLKAGDEMRQEERRKRINEEWDQRKKDK